LFSQTTTHLGSRKEDEVLPAFKELYSSELAKEFRAKGKEIVPLCEVGRLLEAAGNHLLAWLHTQTSQTPKHRLFWPMSDV
jgi:hypothetical protein